MLFLFVCVGENDISSVESLQFDFSSIVAATNNFSDDNKLGEGGFGQVYKVCMYINVSASENLNS